MTEYFLFLIIVMLLLMNYGLVNRLLMANKQPRLHPTAAFEAAAAAIKANEPDEDGPEKAPEGRQIVQRYKIHV